MAKDTKYTADDIQDLSDREHCRLRLPVYFGNNTLTTYKIPLFINNKFEIREVEFCPSTIRAVEEILGNSLDEFSQITSKIKLLKINAKPDIGWYSISDNGRGIPIEQKLDREGVKTWVPELVLSRLRSGRNFTDDKEIGTVGMNGIGASTVIFTSSEADVNIHRNNKHYHQRFIDGALKISKPKITIQASKTTGTEITFQLDPSVFKSVVLPDELIQNRAIEIAMTNPDITVEHNGEKYRYKKGMHDVIEQVAGEKIYHCFEISEPNIVGEIFVILDAHTRQDEQIFTWINSALLYDGGKCNTQFFNAYFDRVISHLETAAKKLKAEVTRNDIRRGLLVLVNLKVKNPEYGNPAKTQLTGPDMRKEIVAALDAQWKQFTKKSDTWLDGVLEYANSRHHQDADDAAIDEHEKKKKLKKKVDGLLDATGKDRSKCKLLIVEGLSASGQICEVRDPSTIGSFALTGKINNVWGTTPAQLLKMGKIADLLSAIGLTPGKRVVRSDLRYGEVYVTSDADFDGDSIFTLLINLFFQFWPEMLSPEYPPMVFRLTSPNVVASKNGKRVHFVNRSDYEKTKTKYAGWNIEYMKGLGSLSKEDWEMVLSNPAVLVPIIDDGNLHDTLTLLFGPDANLRKRWLEVN